MSDRMDTGPAALPRSRGLRGDLRYVLTAAVGAVRARRRLVEIRRAQQAYPERRDMLLRVMARAVMADVSVTLPAVAGAREQMAEIDQRQARSASESATAAAEIAALLDRQEADGIAAEIEVERLQNEIRKTGRELAPLARDEEESRKNLERLQNTLKALDKDLRRLESRLSGQQGAGPEHEAAGLQADLASKRAERESLAQEEAASQAALAALAPRIAGLRTSRHALEQQIPGVREDAREARAGCELRIAAVRERQAAAEEGTATAAADRQAVLRRLGEQLVSERPAGGAEARPEPAAARLRTIDHLDAGLAELDRRAREQEALLAGIDRPALVRGVLILLGIVTLLGAAGAAVLLAFSS